MSGDVLRRILVDAGLDPRLHGGVDGAVELLVGKLRESQDTAARLRSGALDAEHRLRLLADRTDDYGPEGMRTRLIGEYQKLAALAESALSPVLGGLV